MRPKRFIGLLLFCCYLLPIGAEPINVVVEDLTFTRPATWKWEPLNEKSPALARFIVPNGDSKYVVNVRFYNAVRNAAGAVELWSGYFSKADIDTLHQESKKIGNTEVSYISLHGTLTLPAEKPTANEGFVGVVIPCRGKFLHIHCYGQEQLVEKAVPDLKTMVERAVREREDDLASNSQQ